MTVFQLKEVELEPLLFGAKDAAALLSISERTLYRLTNEGAFPVVRMENRTLWCADDLRRWVNEQKQYGSSGKMRGKAAKERRTAAQTEQAETIDRPNGRVE